MASRSEERMRVHAHTRFCFLCVLTFLFHQCSHCHGDGHHHHGHGGAELDHSHGHGRESHSDDHSALHNDHQISQTPYVAPREAGEAGKGHDAETEQRYYIQQLFHRYGHEDKLSFHGFQSLLLSLGLGEVKVVGLKHSEHDHVAHLDLLEVQEGLHSHGADHNHHHHHHHHGGDQTTHSHHHPSSHAEGDGKGRAPTTPAQGTHPCSPKTAGPTADNGPMGPHGHEHDHKHKHVAGDHGHAHDHDYDHDHTHHHHEHGQEGEHKHTHDEHVGDNTTAVSDATSDTNELNEGSSVNQDKSRSSGDQSHPHHHHDHHHHKHPLQHPHNHDHDHDHDHNHEHDHEHDHNHDHKPPANKTASQPVPTRAPANPTLGPRGPTSNSGVRDPRPQGAQPSGAPSPPPTTRGPRPRKPTRGRGQGGRSNRNKPTPTTTPPPHEHKHDDHDHDHHHDHLHDHNHTHDLQAGSQELQGHKHSGAPKRKREVPSNDRRSSFSEWHYEFHQHEECLNLTQLLQHYGLNPHSTINPQQFTYLCPALLYQIDSRLCIRHHLESEEIQTSEQSAMVWVWGFVSITIISLLSLLGVVLVPILNQSCFKFLLTFLVALAVGTLSGDALLHLLPHSQGTHDHSHDKQVAEDVDLLVEFDAVWKSLTALAGIYLLFIIEHCLGMVKHYKDQGGTFCRRRKRSEEAKIGRKLSDHKLNRRSDAEWLHLKPLTEGGDNSTLPGEMNQNDTQLSELQPPDSPSLMPLALADAPDRQQGDELPPAKENGRKSKTKKHGHSHSHGHGHSHGHCHSDQEMKDAGIASIAWMVIMGDGMHNFSDGLAIGAAFSANITGGISTSVAVFCHELPHELGDFAVLLKAGMSVKQAIVYNCLSALMAYVGMLIGTAVGQYTHNVTSWIFAVTAGMFLYVALVDMLPEMLHGDSEEHKRCQFGHFLLQNLGMLTGFGIMLLIAIFEDRIKFDFDL